MKQLRQKDVWIERYTSTTIQYHLWSSELYFARSVGENEWAKVEGEKGEEERASPHNVGLKSKGMFRVAPVKLLSRLHENCDCPVLNECERSGNGYCGSTVLLPDCWIISIVNILIRVATCRSSWHEKRFRSRSTQTFSIDTNCKPSFLISWVYSSVLNHSSPWMMTTPVFRAIAQRNVI